MVVGEITQQRNLIIIGGGPGGYSAAIRAAQLGLSVTLIEQDDLGGVCLNKGCIPSKVFTHAASKRAETSHLHDLGIGAGDDTFNLSKLLTYKDKVISGLRTGVENLCKENKIEVLRGKATFLAVNKIGVENGHQFDIYEFEQVIIATGSTSKMPQGFNETGKRILLSHKIFDLIELPEHLIVYGQDYIALEVASTFAALGAKVTVLFDDQGGQAFDESVFKELNRLFKRRKIIIYKDIQNISINESTLNVKVTFKTNKNTEESIEGSYLFVSGSSQPNLEPLGISRIGLTQSEGGFIQVNEKMQSSIDTIYAIGDVTEGPLLAVKAIKQGKVAVESITGLKSEVDTTFVPIVAHTIPPAVSVGLTEQVAREAVIDVRISQFSLGGNGYASISGKKDGFIKVLSDPKTEIICGIHMIGEGAVEMSGSFVQLLEMAAKEEDVKFPLYAHPGFSEGLLEAVEGLIGQAIHAAPMKKKDLQTV
ncbi:MAG: FAD-dependent oxidoreductase [Paenisporosarcina sp.]